MSKSNKNKSKKKNQPKLERFFESRSTRAEAATSEGEGKGCVAYSQRIAIAKPQNGDQCVV